MMLYRRKQNTLIDAEQFTDEKSPPRGVHKVDDVYDWTVRTTHGHLTRVVISDWIVKEPDGNGFYPIKDHVFKSTYEPV